MSFIRHYGALQGMDKQQTVDKYGKDQVKIWRRSYGACKMRKPALSVVYLMHASTTVALLHSFLLLACVFS